MSIGSFRYYLEEALLLAEDRVQWLKDKHSEPDSIDTSHDSLAVHREPHAVIDHLASFDPNPKKVNTPWILNRYKGKDFRQEDGERVTSALTNFEKYKGKLEKRDINQYKSVSAVEDAVHPHLGQAASRKEEKKGMGALVHEGPGLKVFKVRNEEEATHFSKEATRSAGCAGGFSGGTASWCTVAPNMFKHYAGEDNSKPLYVVHADHKDPMKTRYQLHFHTSQFNDARDKNVGLGDLVKTHPGLRNVTAFRGMHPEFDDKEGLVRKATTGEKYPGGQDPINMDAMSARPRLEAHHLETALKNNGNNLSSIVAHPNAHPDTLHSAWERARETHSSQSMGAVIGANSNARSDTVHDIIARGNDQSMHNVLKNPSLTTDHVEAMANRYSGERDSGAQTAGIHELIASHPKASQSLLKKYAAGSNHIAAMSAIANPAAGPDVLTHAFSHGNASIHAALASNKSTPRNMLEKLSSHSVPFIANTAKKTLGSLK